MRCSLVGLLYSEVMKRFKYGLGMVEVQAAHSYVIVEPWEEEEVILID